MDAVLTRRRIRLWSIVAATVFVTAMVTSWLTVPDQVPLADFAARWSAGRLLVEGRAVELYDLAAQTSVQQTATGTSRSSWFVSPPFVALVLAPLGALPYALAGVAWTLLSVGALTLSFMLLRPYAPEVLTRDWRLTLLVAAASYPVLQVFLVGQDSCFVLLTLAGGIRLLDAGRDVVAGVVLALGLMKPQLIFVVPIVLLVQRRGRALGAFVASAVVLALLSLAVVGPSGIRDWVALIASSDYSESVQQSFAWKAVSVSALLTVLAPDWGQAWQLATVAAGLLVCLPAARAFRLTVGRPVLTWGLATGVAVLASPHVLVYDLVTTAPLLLALACHAWTPRTRVLLVATNLLLWAAAPVHVLIGDRGWPASIVGAPWAALALGLLCLPLLLASREPVAPSEQVVR
ncbi:MAG: glycosyltransferase family 87 protein [Terracoccus sp.]